MPDPIELPAIANNYKVLRVLGSGAFGVAYLIERKRDGKLFALKKVSFERYPERLVPLILQELSIWKQLRSRFTVSLRETFGDLTHRCAYFRMMYCSGGSLRNLIKRMIKERNFIQELFIWKVLSQIAFSLNEMHTLVNPIIIHRDLKPENILLDENNDVKVADFGIGRFLTSSRVAQSCQVGTPLYMAPEIVAGKPYTEKCDIWSLGCVIHELCALMPAFAARDKTNVYKLIVKGSPVIPIPEHYSQMLRTVVQRLMAPREKLRPSAKEILQFIHKHRDCINK